MGKNSEKKDYKVGKGKPPEEYKFKKGRKATGGRPKGSLSLTTILKKYLEKQIDINDPIEKKKLKKRIGDIINLKLLEKALKGNLNAIDMIYDRVEGKPVNRNANLDGQKDDKDFIHKFFGTEYESEEESDDE